MSDSGYPNASMDDDGGSADASSNNAPSQCASVEPRSEGGALEDPGHTFWFVPRKYFFHPPLLAVADPGAEQLGALYRVAAVQDVSDFWFREDVPMPRFQELHRLNILEKRKITFRDVLSGQLQRSLACVSHVWLETDHPDRHGTQLRRIKDWLQRTPHIKAIWMDWLCLPQDHGGAFAKTIEQAKYFEETLSKNHMLFLGLTVLVLWNPKSTSRFWPRFQSWLAMQEATPNGLQLPASHCTRLHLASAGVRGIANAGTVDASSRMRAQTSAVQQLRNKWGRKRPDEEVEHKDAEATTEASSQMDFVEQLRRSWGGLSVTELCDRLDTSDFADTRQKDKTLALHGLQDFEAEYPQRYRTLSGAVFRARTRGSSRASGGYLLKQLVMSVYDATVCHCERRIENDQTGQSAAAAAGVRGLRSRANFMCWQLPPPLCAHCAGSCDCAWKDPFLELLELKADVNGQMLGGETPLLAASQLGQIRLVGFLLGQRADVETSANHQMWTPLHEAARMGRLEMCRVLLRSHDPAHLDGNPDDPAHLNGNPDDVVGVCCHCSGCKGCGHCNGRCICLPNLRSRSCTDHTKHQCRSPDCLSTPLHEAAGGGHVEIVELMLRCRGDANAKLHDGTTPLMRATKRGDADTCKLLLDGLQLPSGRSSSSFLCRGAKLDHFKNPCSGKCLQHVHLPVVDKNGSSAVALALERTRDGRRFGEVMKLLVSRGAK